jgi:hypothetical protein
MERSRPLRSILIKCFFKSQPFFTKRQIVDLFFLFADKYDYDTGYELSIGEIYYPNLQTFILNSKGSVTAAFAV